MPAVTPQSPLKVHHSASARKGEMPSGVLLKHSEVQLYICGGRRSCSRVADLHRGRPALRVIRWA